MRTAATLAYRAATIGVGMELDNLRTYDLPWSRRVWLYRHWFTSSRGVLYDLDEDSVHDYLNDIHTQRIRVNHRQWNDAELLDDKRKFHDALSQSHPEHATTLVATVTPDTGLVTHPEGEPMDTDELRRLAAADRLVVKPTRGCEGQDIHVVGHSDDGFRLDGSPVSPEELLARLEAVGDAIVTPFVEQAEYAARIYPGASNTLRLLTMIHPETGTPFIAAAVHRFGTEESGHVDNWSAGGVSVDLNTETGELGKGALSPKGNDSFTRVESHPDTGATFVGTMVPGWDAVRTGILDIAAQFSDRLKCVGWDVIVTDREGGFTVIEGNAAPDIDLMQTHGPLLTDDRVVAFYDHHGVI